MNWKVIELPKNKYPIKAEFEMKNPIGVTIHETDNNAPAANEIAYMQRNDNKVSFHFAVDEKEIIQGLPLDRNGWHAGDGRNGKGNRQTISIEICRNYRTDDLTNYYKARKNAEELVGYLLFKYNWTDKDIYTHNYWIGKNCPRVILKENYLPTFKKKAMEHKAKFAGEKPTPKPSDLQFKVGDLIEFSYLYENHHLENQIAVPYKNHLGRGYGYVVAVYPLDNNPYVVAKEKGGKPIGGVRPVNIYRAYDSDILKQVSTPTPSKPNGKQGQLLVVRKNSYHKTTFTVYKDKALRTPLRIYQMKDFGDLQFMITEDADPIFKVKQWSMTPMDGKVNVGYIKWESGIGFDNVNVEPTLRVGSKVKITGTRYATGQVIPTWVKKRTHTVQEITQDRVLLKEIQSWVYRKDVEL